MRNDGYMKKNQVCINLFIIFIFFKKITNSTVFFLFIYFICSLLVDLDDLSEIGNLKINSYFVPFFMHIYELYVAHLVFRWRIYAIPFMASLCIFDYLWLFFICG